MSKDLWSAIDRYIEGALLRPDPVLDAALQANAAAGLPAIDVAPNQGKLLYLLAQMQGARSILEIGSLGGYSTIWLARALPVGGKLVTLEVDAKHAEVARSNLARAGLRHAVDVRVGPALDTLAARLWRLQEGIKRHVECVRDAGERVNCQVGPVLNLLHPLHRRPELARERLLGEPPLAAKFRDTAADVANQAVGFVASHGARRSQAAI